MRGRAQHVALRRVVDLALDQLVDDRRNLGEAPRGGERAHLQSQRRSVQARLALELRELLERDARLVLLQRHVRLEHEPGHRRGSARPHPDVRAAPRPREIAHVDRRARAEQRGQPARLRDGERFLGELPRLAVAALEQRDDRGILLAARAIEVAPAAALAHLAPACARCATARRSSRWTTTNARITQHDERVERELHAIGRRDEQRVARVELEQQRRQHRERGEQQEREEQAHERERYRAAPAPARRRSRVAFTVRSASRLAARSGSSAGIGVAASCVSVADQRLHGLRARVEVLLHPRVGGGHVGLEAVRRRATAARCARRAGAAAGSRAGSTAAAAARAAPRHDRRPRCARASLTSFHASRRNARHAGSSAGGADAGRAAAGARRARAAAYRSSPAPGRA